MTHDLILVVDDDPDTCQLVSTMLSNDKMQVEAAFDGFHGLELTKHLQPALVLLDVMMPGMDGWETYQNMRAVSDSPVLFLSALDDIKSIAQGFDLGAADYVTKPFSPDELRGMVAKALEKKSEAELDQTQTGQKQEHILGSRDLPRSYIFLKRALDILISAGALLLLSPILLLSAILIKLETPGPVIYRQRRLSFKVREERGGKVGRLVEFPFYKLRTMVVEAKEDLHQAYVDAFIRNDQTELKKVQGNGTSTRKLVNDPRVTKIGKFLRRTSLDEIPQLWNVIKGDMTLVGPRPPLPYEVEAYSPWHKKRLAGKPGVTGLWQVTSRSSAEFDEMVRMDLWYLEHQSLRLDLEILFKTPLAVLSLDGAY